MYSGPLPAHLNIALREPLYSLYLPCYIYVLPMKKTISQTNLPGCPSICPSVNKAEVTLYLHQTWARVKPAKACTCGAADWRRSQAMSKSALIHT